MGNVSLLLIAHLVLVSNYHMQEVLVFELQAGFSAFNKEWVNCSTEVCVKLQRVQNDAARVITFTKKHNHITPVLKELQEEN